MAARAMLASLLVLGTFSRVAAVEWGENVIEDTTWQSALSPYIIVDNVRVRMNSTLTIEPGVEVRFDGRYSLSTDPGSSIVADGTSDALILFTSNAAVPGRSDWDRIRVYSSPCSSFRFCVIRYAYCGLHCIACDPPIDRCVFRFLTQGVFCQRASPTIQDCEIKQVSSAGILCRYSDTSPVISGCNLYDNTAYNIMLMDYYTPPVVMIDARGNWWGTADEQAIDDTIHDNADNPDIYGQVDYSGWLTAPLVEPSSWGRIKAAFRG